jgi:hypothetical protein
MTDYTDDQLLAMAMANIGEYIHDNSPQYILIDEDPRNEDDYDSWTYGMEVLPKDHTWQSTSIDVDVSPSDANMAE